MLLNWRSSYLSFLSTFLYTIYRVNTKNTAHFSGLGDSHISVADASFPKNCKNDLSSISFSSSSAGARNLLNEPNFSASITSTTNGSAQQRTGYLVTDDGTFKFPELEKIKAEGLTVIQRSNLITQQIMEKELPIESIVTLRFLNFRLPVLDKVAHSTVGSIPNEKINVLEVLGPSVDTTVYSRTDNVFLIWGKKGMKLIKRINSNSKDIISSPYFYSQTTDVIYSDASKEKISSVSNTRQILPVYFAAISLFITVTYLVLCNYN
jgi:polysaccharide export outer membrane protein